MVNRDVYHRASGALWAKLRVLDKRLGIGRLTQISLHGDDFAVCLACNLRHHCHERLLATRAATSTPSRARAKAIA